MNETNAMTANPEDTTVPEASADVAEMMAKKKDPQQKNVVAKKNGAASKKNAPSLSKSKSEFGRISWDICDRLRCESCGNAASAPVYQCSGGHVLCVPCSNKLVTCPNKNCEATIHNNDMATNAALGRIAARTGVLLPCRNKNCDWRVRHVDLARHEKYCRLIRNGFMSPSLKKEEKEAESSKNKANPDTMARASIREELNCSLCNHASPAPIMQCRNGHVACYHCLGRLRQFDEEDDKSSICPLCPVPHNDGTVVRNLHLEGMATFCQMLVPCRWCEIQMKHADLANHLALCEFQPVKCIHCNIKCTKGVALENWDVMWDHYQGEHLPTCTPTPLSEMIVTAEKIESLQNTNQGFLTWSHCLDEQGNAVPLFPGLLYHKPMDAFFFSVRLMGPLDKHGLYHMRVEPNQTLDAELVVVEAKLPPTSYRVGYLDEATLATAAKMVREAPCLVISRPTVERMLEVSQDGSLVFRVANCE